MNQKNKFSSYSPVLKLIITLLIIGVIVSRIDIGKLQATISSIRSTPIIAAFAITIASSLLNPLAQYFFSRAMRLYIPYPTLLSISVASYFFSFIHQIAGGAYRWHQFSGTGNRRGEAFLLIVYERIWTLGALFIVSVISYFCIFSKMSPSLHGPVTLLYTIVGCGFVLFFLSFVYQKRIGSCLSKRVSKNHRSSFSKMWAKIDDIYRINTTLAHNRKDLISGLLIYALNTLICMPILYFIFLSIHLVVPLPVLWWIASTTVLFQSIPLTLFGIGIREGTLILCLSFCGLDREAGLTAGILILGLSVGLGLLGGIVYAIKQLRIKSVGYE
jgi:uncharacterized membrane protein YbhN (UPF0104 family)